MNINFEKNTIELSTSEMNEARKYGSQAYNDLRDARRDNPGYRVVEVKAKRVKNPLGKVTLADIRAYVKAHGSKAQKEEFLSLSTPTITEDGLYIEPRPFFEITKWFFAEFPQVRAESQKRLEAIRKINEAIDDKIAAAKKKALEDAIAKAKAKAEEYLEVA